jgi:crotonobetainyl-CoA:carnitine CoA-transferase CaiB-like acyl-CoA transferase
MPKIQASSALATLRSDRPVPRSRGPRLAIDILTDFGADVIRVEPPPGVDPNEAMLAANRKGGDFQNVETDERPTARSTSKSPAPWRCSMRLVAEADVVVETGGPDVGSPNWALIYDCTGQSHTRASILASISGFGQDGPYAWRPGLDAPNHPRHGRLDERDR